MISRMKKFMLYLLERYRMSQTDLEEMDIDDLIDHYLHSGMGFSSIVEKLPDDVSDLYEYAFLKWVKFERRILELKYATISFEEFHAAESFNELEMLFIERNTRTATGVTLDEFEKNAISHSAVYRDKFFMKEKMHIINNQGYFLLPKTNRQ